MEELQEQVLEYAKYLDEIRSRLYKTALVFLVLFASGFFGAGYIVQLSVNVFSLPTVTIAASSPFQYVDLATDIGIFLAIVLTFPYALYHLYSFLKPAISKRERRLFWLLIPVMLVLFFLGFGYGGATLYIAFRALAVLNSTLGISNIWNISQFLAELVVTAALLGIFFEFPVLLTFLIRVKVLPIEYLITKRRHAYVVIFVFVSLLPPTDGVSLIMTALPLVGIYELTIFINRAYKRTLLITN